MQLLGVFNKRCLSFIMCKRDWILTVDLSQDAIKCAETLQKLIALYRKNGSRQQVYFNHRNSSTIPKLKYLSLPLQIISGLSYYLPESNVYSLLSTLPPPDPTNPTGSTTYDAQEAIHNGFRVLEEVVALTEALEADTFKREVERRRMRLGAGSPEQLRKEVFLEIFDKSQVGCALVSNHCVHTDSEIDPHIVHSYPLFMNPSLIILILRMTCDAKSRPSSCGISNNIYSQYRPRSRGER